MGRPVVQIPLDEWNDFAGDAEHNQSQPSQYEQIKALLEKWRNEPDDDMSDAWWDEFQEFLNENRVRF